MATHSSVLAWKIPWTEELMGYSPRGHKELDKTERLKQPTTTKQRNIKEFADILKTTKFCENADSDQAGPGKIPQILHF